MNIRQNLVEDFNEAHKWLSMRFMSLSIFCQGLEHYWPKLPTAFQNAFPSWMVQAFALGALFFGASAMAGRVVKQK